MIKPVFVAMWLACCALLLPVAPEGSGASALGAQALPAAAARGRDRAPAPPGPSDSLKVVLLGTGVGPPVNLQQYGASILVEVGGERFLFDCGRGPRSGSHRRGSQSGRSPGCS